MPVSMFDTRTMLAALEQMPRPKTFLRDTFFRNVKTFDTTAVDIDIVKGKRRVAVYVSPKQQGHVVDRAGYTTNTYTPPYIKEKMITTAADLLKRGPGENIYSAKSPEQRAAEQLNKDLTELDELITRAEEIQAAQALFYGKVTVKDGAEISFGLANDHNLTLTTTDLWNDSAITKALILKQLRAWRLKNIKDSGVPPTDLILGSDAAEAFITVFGSADTGALSSVKIIRGQIEPQLLPNGVTYWGFLPEIGVDVWSYDEWYHNGSADVAMVPTKKVCLVSKNARFDRYYGAIQDLSALYATDRFPKSWEEEDPSARFIMLQSAPLLAPHQVDSFLVASVLS